MSDTGISSTQMQGFRTAVESLKLYRRADLHDPEQGSPLIEELYVDPLPHEDVFKTALRPHTTFVIGRKGTGKSTIFQRLQHELRKSNSHTSAYLDIKTIYESSQPDQALITRLEARPDALPSATIEKLTLYREFLRATVRQVQEELKRRIQSSIWERVKESFTQTYAELFEELDSLLEEASEDNFVSVLGILETQFKESASNGNTTEQAAGIFGSFGAQPSIKISTSDKAIKSVGAESVAAYGDLLIRAFNIREFLERLKRLLSKIGIRHLYILVDDFSELPEEAMKVVVDALIAPLNNWSDEFVKFKVAAYPGRIYYGAIDKTKIDEVYLDLYSLFGTSDVATMEASAMAFTQRLVESRLAHYTKCNSSTFFDTKSDEIWKSLFFSSMANPRTLGYVLHFAYQNQLIHGKKISLQGLQDASLKYYEEKIASYFSAGRFLHETFSERCSIYSLKELLEKIVSRARELRSHKSAVFEKISGRPPTSHFHVTPSYDTLLSTLELNFFLTKYFEMSDRDGRKVSVYALNYGLCQRYSIAFGRPTGEREFRLYFVERVFDYGPIISAFIERNQEVVCGSCGARQEIDKLEALKLYGMKCPACQVGICEVVNLSKKYEPMLKSIQAELLLPKTELGILQTLHSEGEPQRPSDIAAELDCSYQLVGRRSVRLEERGLVKRIKDENNNRIIKITDIAEASYFSDSESNVLDVGGTE
ncbi:MAG: MarR family transcriptional regulator [Gammaproteobacteria bacterium]|nr:MAG: MarR family transcriptional regulator [Gammaproteobacteria bacterium]